MQWASYTPVCGWQHTSPGVTWWVWQGFCQWGMWALRSHPKRYPVGIQAAYIDWVWTAKEREKEEVCISSPSFQSGTSCQMYSCIEWAGLGVHVSFAWGVALSCLAQVPWPNWLKKKFVPPSSPLAETGPRWGFPSPLRGPGWIVDPSGIIYSSMRLTAYFARCYLVGLAGVLPVGYVSS